MRARHEALARDIMTIHQDFFMSVYGYRKVHAQLIAQGWDPNEVGRDQVARIMRGLGIQGVRRGKTPVTTKSVKGGSECVTANEVPKHDEISSNDSQQLDTRITGGVTLFILSLIQFVLSDAE